MDWGENARYVVWIVLSLYVVFVSLNVRHPHPMPLMMLVSEPLYTFLAYLFVFFIAGYDFLSALLLGVVIYTAKMDLQLFELKY